MSTNYHSEIALGAAVTSPVVNAPFATLDQQLTTITASVAALESEIADARDSKASLLISIQTNVSADAVATPGSSGTAGQTAFDGDYFYVCIDTDTWGRVALEKSW